MFRYVGDVAALVIRFVPVDQGVAKVHAVPPSAINGLYLNTIAMKRNRKAGRRESCGGVCTGFVASVFAIRLLISPTPGSSFRGINAALAWAGRPPASGG